MTGLISNLNRLRGRVLRIVLLRGLTLWLAAVLAAFGLLGWLDWSLRFESLLFRWPMSLLLWSVAIAGFIRLLWRPWQRRPGVLDVALWIEDVDPRWNGELAAAVAFSLDDSAEIGVDADLRRGVVGRINERLTEEDLRRRGSRRQLLSWGLGLCLLLAATVTAAQAYPEVTSLATARLVYPDQHLTWPRRTRLELMDANFQPLPTDRPVPLDRAGPLEILVRNRIGDPPSVVELEVRHAGGAVTKTLLPPQQRRNPEGVMQTVLVGNVNPGRDETFRIRAVGGDDRHPAWVTLARRTPPALTRFVVTVSPPAYLGLEDVVLEQVAGPVSAIVGSTIHIDGKLDRPAGSVRFKQDDGPETPIPLDESTHFQFEISVDAIRQEPQRISLFARRDDPDVQVFSTGDSRPMRYLEIVGVEDEPPRVQLLTPSGDVRVTSEAVLPLRAVARDDFRLARLTIIARIGDAATEFEATDAPPSGNEWTVNGELVIADWAGRVTGPEATRLGSLHAVADDYNPRTEPQSSSPVSVTIVTVEEKLNELESALRQAAEEIAELLAAQQQVREQTLVLLRRQAREGQLRETDLPGLKQATHAQGTLATRMSEAEQGLLPRAVRLTWEIDVNRLDDHSLAAAARTMAEELDDLAETSLRRSHENLTSLDRMGTALASPAAFRNGPDSPEALFAGAAAAQQQTISRLEAILQVLRAWRSQSTHQTEWEAIVSEFQDLLERTMEVGRETFSRGWEDLTPPQREALSEVEQRHRRLAGRIDRFLRELSESSGPTREISFRRLATELEQSRVVDDLSAAARELARNRVPQALQLDQRVNQAFERATRTPAHGPSASLAQGLKVVEDALDWISWTIDQQRHLGESMDETWRLSDARERGERLEPFVQRQAALAEEAAQWATRLRFTQLPLSARLLNDAAREMQEFEQQVLGPQRPAVAAHSGRIIDALERARQDLLRIRGQLQLAVDSRNFLELGDRARALADRQDLLTNETMPLIAEFEQQGSPTRQLRGRANRVAEQQQKLVAEVQLLRDEAAALPVVAFALDRVHDDMSAAARLLLGSGLSEKITRLQAQAAEQLRELFAVTQLDPPQGPPSSPSASESGMGEPSPRQLGELALLIRLQEQLVARSETLLGEGRAEFSEELQRIAAEQEQLARLIRQFFDGPVEASRE